MTPERLKRIEEIYHAALEIPLAGRESFLVQNCGADVNLRFEVESLLAFEKSFDAFIDTPPESLAAEMFSERERAADFIDRQIGRYKIKSFLGRGGMGEVYLAEDTRLDRRVALKILPENFVRDAERMRRFVSEAKSASALNHPNIITIHEIGDDGSTHFIAAEFIEGETLFTVFKKQHLDLNSALDIAIQIASSLAAAHHAGIVHRDIKPENIMIRPDGLVKVLDFGIAKISFGNGVSQSEFKAENPKLKIRNLKSETALGTIVGTASYMSPEQWRGKTVDARSDIFSFGIVLYEMLSGKKPFAGENAAEISGAIMHKEPIPLNLLRTELPPEIEQIVNRMLRKDCGERFQTAKEVLADLRGLKRRFDYEQITPGFYFEKSKAESIEQKTEFSASSAPTVSSAEYVFSEVKKHKFASFGALGIFAAMLATILYASFFVQPARSKSINSLAVLPFVNESGDGDDEYLSDGLSENLINKISQLRQLKVIARSSVFKYKGSEIDLQEIARALGVQALVTGRVARRGAELQISVELINAEDKTQIWGEIYNRKITDAQTVQEEIARTVSQKLRLQLSGAQEQRIATRLTENPQAYQLYLNGVFYRRKNGTENIKKAIEYQNQAIALDPDFALAYTELSNDYLNLVSSGVIDPREGTLKSRAAVEKALVLDETLAAAHNIIANLKMNEFDWNGAESEFKRAIELNSNLAAAHTLYAVYLSQLKRFDEALGEIRRAQELDPLRTGLIGNEGVILYQARRYDEAIPKLEFYARDAPDNPSAHFNLAQVYTVKERFPEAISQYQTSAQIEETTGTLIYLGRAYALYGKRSEAIAVLEKLKTTEKYVSPADLSILYAALGDKESAFASLEQAYAARDSQLTALKAEPGYDALRSDSRFDNLARRVGIP